MKNTNKLFVELTSEEASMIIGGSRFGKWAADYFSSVPKKMGDFVVSEFRAIGRWFR